MELQARLKQFQSPQVRDLAWAILSPSLMKTTDHSQHFSDVFFYGKTSVRLNSILCGSKVILGAFNKMSRSYQRTPREFPGNLQEMSRKENE